MKIKLRHWAFLEGASGYSQNCSKHDNPYEIGTTAHREWLAGWKHALAEKYSATVSTALNY